MSSLEFFNRKRQKFYNEIMTRTLFSKNCTLFKSGYQIYIKIRRERKRNSTKEERKENSNKSTYNPHLLRCQTTKPYLIDHSTEFVNQVRTLRRSAMDLLTSHSTRLLNVLVKGLTSISITYCSTQSTFISS